MISGLVLAGVGGGFIGLLMPRDRFPLWAVFIVAGANGLLVAYITNRMGLP